MSCFLTGAFPARRMRRMRSQAFSRSLMKEAGLASTDLIAPFFIQEGVAKKNPVAAMPGIYQLSCDLLLKELEKVATLSIPAILLFPVVPKEKKDPLGTEAWQSDGLLQRAIREIKRQFPQIGIVTDVALDPFTDHGHDGLLDASGNILNDETLEVLVRQALSHAEAGADTIAPSDMMDGRIGSIRHALEAALFKEVQILSYSAKYASSYYGPFRSAVGAEALQGQQHKKSYQMDPANRDEALHEVAMDIAEGADMVMIKPGMPYLDVIQQVKAMFRVPTIAYQVSGEYVMHKAAAANGWLDEQATVLEALTCFKRAGADAIVTYFAIPAAQWLQAPY